MGNVDCCAANQDELQIQLLPGEIMEEKKFLAKFDKIQEVLKTNQFPKMDIKKNITHYKEVGVYLGKQNVKIRKGLGIMLYKYEGLYYIGNWSADQKHGLGVMIDSNGNYYIGEWYKDKPHGYGEYYNHDKSLIYKGKWKVGVKEGLGQQIYTDGSIFRGLFKEGLKNGKGKFIYQNGCYFQGNFVNDLAEGHGVQKGQNFLYEGQWLNSDMHGTGKCTYFEDQTAIEWYIGQFKYGQKSGYGEYRWSDGRIYKGEWQNGEIQSKGVFINKK